MKLKTLLKESNDIHWKKSSLEGAPEEVGDFYCADNQLTSLEGAPKKVDGYFYCGHNKLTSLEGAPKKVGLDFNCHDNKLTSLEGAPKEVGGYFDCNLNKLTSLKNIHKIVNAIKGKFSCHNNPIKSHVLGLLLIKGINGIRLDNNVVENILNKHLGEGKAGVIDAQRELEDAGLDEYAQL